MQNRNKFLILNFNAFLQSLFTRLVRLGVPTVDLDSQGRARSSISALYKWRYKKLNDLQHVLDKPEYTLANPGFAYEYQMINVENFNGVGETEPNQFFYQNLAEAEYVVAVFMYMRLLGYPAEKISILTTYNGQKHLIRDVINLRCGENPLIGHPLKVTTVDKYQGQQNDYILLSLVRTKAVGHLRDVRRLVVAMSRARLGLYIFGRVSLFKDCYELQPVFNILLKKSTKLHLLTEEMFPCERKLTDSVENEPKVISDMSEMADFVHKLYLKRVNDMKENIDALKKLYEKLPAEEENESKDDDAEEENAENQKKVVPMETDEFVPKEIQNEVDVDVSELESK